MIKFLACDKHEMKIDLIEVLNRLNNEFRGGHGRTPWRQLLGFALQAKLDPLFDRWEMNWKEEGEVIPVVTLSITEKGAVLKWITTSKHFVNFFFGAPNVGVYELEKIIMGKEKSECFYPEIRRMFLGETIEVSPDILTRGDCEQRLQR